MILESTPNIDLKIPTRTQIHGSLDLIFNENLRKIDAALGNLTGAGYTIIITSDKPTNIEIDPSNNNQDETVLTLSANVYSAAQDITSQFLSDKFIWRRRTFFKPDNWVEDIEWNTYYFSNRSKKINITRSEVDMKATFYCDLEGLV
jgi:hypothetical protein